MNDLEIIILAAGKGSRMGSDKPKVLTELQGKPMLSYVLATVKKIHDWKPIVVLGYKADEVKGVIGNDQRYIMQKEQLGTGHAVREAIAHISPQTKHLIVLYGDQPLINAETVIKLYEAHLNQTTSPLTLGVIDVPDFEDWRKTFYDFGRVVTNTEGKITRIVEKKDATSDELQIKKLNPSYFCFDYDWLVENIFKLEKKNAQGEYYLTDMIGIATKQGFELNSCTIPTQEALGVNTPEQLELVTNFVTREEPLIETVDLTLLQGI